MTTMIKDVVFAQHYEKSMQQFMQNAFNAGCQKGFNDAIAIIEMFNQNNMPVTIEAIQLFLQDQEKQQDSSHQNPCNEVVASTSTECVLPMPEVEKRKSTFRVVK